MSVIATPIMSQRQPHHLFNGQQPPPPPTQSTSPNPESVSDSSILPPPATERRPFVARANLFLNFAQQRSRATNHISVSLSRLDFGPIVNFKIKGDQSRLANSNFVANLAKWNNLLPHSHLAKFTSFAN